MRFIITLLPTLIAALGASTARACEVCQVDQPKIVSAFTHGTDPSGPADYIPPALMVLVMAYAFARTFTCFRRSADRPHQTIKRSILAAETK